MGVLQRCAVASGAGESHGARCMDWAGAAVFEAAQWAGHPPMLPGRGLHLLDATPSVGSTGFLDQTARNSASGRRAVMEERRWSAVKTPGRGPEVPAGD
jgi:hypothetical protein